MGVPVTEKTLYVELDVVHTEFDWNYKDKESLDLEIPTFDKKRGGMYSGKLNQYGERSGAGIYHWENGSRYFGYWKADEFHGRGRYVLEDGGFYEGKWADGLANGTGKF